MSQGCDHTADLYPGYGHLVTRKFAPIIAEYQEGNDQLAQVDMENDYVTHWRAPNHTGCGIN